LSNVVKGGIVRYDNDVKVLDYNQKAEEIIKEVIERQIEEQKRAAEESFIAGITAKRMEQNEAGEWVEELTDEQMDRLNEQQESEDAYARRRHEETEHEVEELLKGARDEAAKLVEEAKERIAREREETLAKARDNGHKDGLKKGEKEVSAKLADLEAQKREFAEEKERVLKSIEPMMVSLVIDLVYKLTGVLLEGRKGIIVHIVQQALEGYEPSNSFIIHASKEDYGTLQSAKDRLVARLREGANLVIIEDEVLGKSQCLIETDSRVIDCSLDVQLGNLAESLKMLVN